MGKRSNSTNRGAWLVDHGNGEIEILRELASVRWGARIGADVGSPARHLSRLAPGVYYYVTRYDTPDGPRPCLVTVRRISDTRARQELDTHRLAFEAPDGKSAAVGSHGL
jgi:hypothetical protein